MNDNELEEEDNCCTCIYSEDSESKCRKRGCVRAFALGELKDWYEKKPAVEPHGDLIDRDALLKEKQKWWREEEIKDLMDAPVVVAARESWRW